MKDTSLKEIIRDVPDFPKEGILFKDITPLLQSPEAFRFAVDQITGKLNEAGVDVIVGIESRGFIFCSTVAYNLNIGFVPVRKKGKLPWKTHEVAYSLEYGEEILQIHQDAIGPGKRVAIVDDLLATGGTAKATGDLVEKSGGEVVTYAFLVELSFLKGREKLAPHEVYSVIQY